VPCFFFPKQLTVGVLNATFDLAALVLVGVVGFLGSEVVLSPVVSHCLPLSPIVSGCLPLCGGWVLVGVAAFLPTPPVLSFRRLYSDGFLVPKFGKDFIITNEEKIKPTTAFRELIQDVGPVSWGVEMCVRVAMGATSVIRLLGRVTDGN